MISNHPDHAEAVRFLGPADEHVAIIDGNKAAQEKVVLALLDDNAIDVVVLARYMQILSGDATRG